VGTIKYFIGEKSERTIEEFLWELNRVLQEKNSTETKFCREKILYRTDSVGTRKYFMGGKSERTIEEFLWELKRFLQETNSTGTEFCRGRIL